MNETQSETDRLHQRRHDEENARRQKLGKEIAQIQGNARCVRRAAGLMAVLTALAVAALSYPTILLENFPDHAPTIIMNLIYALGVGSLTSLLAFAFLGRIYRKKLRQHELAYRQTNT
jgi:hypothetical protein